VFKKILVAYDNGVQAKKALETGILMAKDADAELFIYNSVRMPNLFYNMTGQSMTEKLQEQVYNYFKPIMEEAAAKAVAAGVNAHSVMEDQPAGAGIVGFAEKNSIGLIIIGSHNHKPVERFFLGLGSVSNHVINHAKCPVMVIKG